MSLVAHLSGLGPASKTTLEQSATPSRKLERMDAVATNRRTSKWIFRVPIQLQASG
ncbi:predicted protein [Pyrenophora tritici-repentis Pt-1C-BFP]|uniref:Uncharacterized protein n=1 Tax=Pyrenophora tritici-repentis (strain Pt-1C-BFP) TaxID=426418 RepID=B2W9I6_PYRTR|nr:uncharacterized protein PTRG_06644 [Pyrenophora tritici-repentis Pt-1C-BFP]EDU49564.1 predicted protein [Pyrenophora tritici-repentis Pt-1C-BFP]